MFDHIKMASLYTWVIKQKWYDRIQCTWFFDVKSNSGFNGISIFMDYLTLHIVFFTDSNSSECFKMQVVSLLFTLHFKKS